MKAKYILLSLLGLVLVLYFVLHFLLNIGGGFINSFEGNTEGDVNLIVDDIYYDKRNHTLLKRENSDLHSVIAFDVFEVRRDSLFVYAYTSEGKYAIDILTNEKIIVSETP